MPLNKVTITGTFDDGSGTALSGTAVFTPSQTVYYNGQPMVSAGNPVSVAITGGALQAVQLVATDNTPVSFTGQTGFWFWTVSVTLNGITQPSWSFFLPSNPSTKDLYSLAGGPALGGIFLPLAGGNMTGWLAPAVVNLSQSAGSVAVNAALGNDFRLTLTASGWAIANPSNPADGQMIEFQFAQDATGSRTVSWGTAYDFGGAGTPVLSTTASKVDIVGFKYNASLGKWLLTGVALGF